MAAWYSLRSLGIFFPVLVCLDREKSGNPDGEKEKIVGKDGRKIWAALNAGRKMGKLATDLN
jgi:hypothetical protein